MGVRMTRRTLAYQIIAGATGHIRQDSPSEKRTGSVLIFPVLAVVHLQHAASKGKWVLNMHIIFDESAHSSPLVGSTELQSTHPAMRCKPRLGNKN
jgi:hypothetical protein